MKAWHNLSISFRSNILLFASLFLIIALSVAVRINQPITHPGIGEIDVYYWALRTQEFELHGIHGIGTTLWFTPVIMSALHWVTGGDLYNLFLWAGSFISAILPVIAIYLLSKELTQSKIASLFGALIYGVTPIVFYRSVFTVSETFAYIFIPLVLYLSIRLSRKRNILSYSVLVAVLFLAMNTHDSSKLLYLPVLFSAIIFFWTTRKKMSTQLTILLTVVAVIILLLRNPSIIAGIKFLLTPSNSGNSAFGDYDPLSYTTYTNIIPILFTGFTIFGFFAGLWYRRKAWLQVIQLSLFALPIIFYQQVLPRISNSTIVPTRLTPYLTFIIVPFIALSVYGWIRITDKSRKLQIIVLSIGLITICSRISFANFPLTYITSKTEQESLKKIPISSPDLIIVQTGMIGMTSVATKTNESSYYGDSTDKIFGATSPNDVKNRIRIFRNETKLFPTGILISKWKLLNRDPYYGWWDSLVNPVINIDVFRAANLPVRFEDNNIILFDVPNTL